ncbi:conserved Plasmodium protein, unknown function [Plasmodium sp. DRC-Itaito]|nr:conserved Plasmodium protein, unknown function [Plasmodium sp. DRC-Itaito]
MKILYICDTRFHLLNTKEKKYLYKYWSYSLQDILNGTEARDIHFWLVCINLIDYIDLITFSDLFNYVNVKNAIDKFSDYFQMDNENLIKENKFYVDPLLAFLKNAENTSKIKECDKIIILSCNIYLWENEISDLQIIGDVFYTFMCKFYFFNVKNKTIDTTNSLEHIQTNLKKYHNFFFKNIELNKIDILQISKEILSINFSVFFTLNLKNELLFKCEGCPLINEISYSAFIGLNTYPVEFDIRAKALKEGISQHLIYGIPIFIYTTIHYETNLISLESLSSQLFENKQVLILRSNINPTDLNMHDKDVRFLWVASPMIKEDQSIILCLHGLSTLENYSLSIEESYANQRTDNEKNYITDKKLNEIFNFLILIEEFNPFDYSNQRLEYSFKFSKSSLSNILQKTNRTKKSKKLLTKIKNNTCLTDNDSHNINKDTDILLVKENQDLKKKKKKNEITDPRFLLLTNMNKAFQKNII